MFGQTERRHEADVMVLAVLLYSLIMIKLDWESIRSSPRDGLGDFGFWGLGIDNNVPVEDGGLLQVLPLTVHLNFF